MSINQGRRAVAASPAVRASAALADSIDTPLVGGRSTSRIQPDVTFDLNIVLTSDAGDLHDSTRMRLICRTASLQDDNLALTTPRDQVRDDVRGVHGREQSAKLRDIDLAENF